MFSLDQLQTLICVYESGSFSAAARKLGKAQSGVSQAIANLEIDLDKPLFIREKGGITPSENLLELLPSVRQLLRQAEILAQKCTALAHDEPLHLSIALEEGLWHPELFQRIQHQAAQYPQMELEILISSSFDIEKMVADGAVQLGVVYQDTILSTLSTLSEISYLGDYRFISVAHPSHPLVQQSAVNFATLLQHRHIVHRSLSRQAATFSPALSENCWYCNDYQTVCQLVRQNAGWADLPENLVQAELANGELVRLNLDFEPDGNRGRVLALHSASHRHQQVSAEMVAALRAWLKEEFQTA